MAYRYPQKPIISKPPKVGIEQLRENIQKYKQEIKDNFKTYHQALYETEIMVLSDLDGILVREECDRRDIAGQIEEVETVKRFMQEQLKSSINQVLTNNVATLNQEIRNLKYSEAEVPPIKLHWKFNYILRNIHELCTIEEGPSLYKDRALKRSFLQKGDGKLELSECLDFCYDKQDKQYYLVNETGNDDCGPRNLLVLDSKFNILSSHDLGDSLYHYYIKTSAKFIFVHYGCNGSTIMQINKRKINNKGIKMAPSVLCFRFDIFGDHLFVPSDSKESNEITICKLLIQDLKVVQHIPIKKSEYADCQFVDIKVTETEIYLLFNCSKERSLHCFDHSGVFLREIISNTRGLQNPLISVLTIMAIF